MEGEELTEMAELRDAGAAGFSDDGLPISNAGVLRRALQYQRLVGAQIALHEEDHDLSRPAGAHEPHLGGAMHEGPVSAALGLAGIPSVAESTMIARDAALAAYEDARIHVQHLSARESVEAVAAAKQAGVKISCEATPHHLTLVDEEVRSLDSRFKMNPPLRSEDDRQALIEGLRSGVIDCVATDHAPHSVDEKEVPFEEAAMGVTGLETAFCVLHTDLVLPGVLELAVLVDRMSAGAAAVRTRASQPRPGKRGEPGAVRSRGRVGGGRRGLGEPLPQLLLRRTSPARPGADDRGRRPGRLPPAQLRDGSGRLSAQKLDPKRAALVVIDVQEAFRKAVPGFEQIANATAALVKGAEAVGVPIVVTEQYPKGLGTTAPEIAEHLPEGVEPDREGLLLGPGGRGLRPRRVATRRSSAGSRRTSASTRRCSTCSTRASRCTWRATRSGRASTRTGRSGWRRPSAPAR